MRMLSACATACVLLWAFAATQISAQTQVDFSQGFDSGAFIPPPSRISERGVIQSCSGATAAVSCAAANARSGNCGALLTVKNTCANWRLVMQTRDVVLTQSRSYALCMWVKSNYTAKPFLPKIAFSFYRYNGAAGTLFINAVQPRITNSWAKYCYRVHKVPTDGATYFFTLNVGNAAANTSYAIDDISLESEPNASWDNWMGGANARIEQLRKGDFSLELQYNDGTPVPPAVAVSNVGVRLLKHDFPFALAYSPENFARADPLLPWYKSQTTVLFNALVPESTFTWTDYEPKRPATPTSIPPGRALLNDYYAFMAQNDFQIFRPQHCEWYLADASFNNHWSRTANCSAYDGFLQHRIEMEFAAFPDTVKSVVMFNEILDRRNYADSCNLFAGGPDSIIVKAFKWAQAVRPNIRLCLNDYNLIEDDRFVNLLELIDWLQANGAPVGCIGVQSHLDTAGTMPDTLAYRIEKLSSLTSLPLEITEISFHTAEDPATWDQLMTDDAAQADAFEKMYTTYFSHPLVTSTTMWGFTDANHFITNGGIYHADGTPKPAGVVMETLLTQTWNTSSPGLAITAVDGLQTFRGFYGRYEVTATIDGTPATGRANFTAAAGGTQTAVVMLDIAPPPTGGRRLLRAGRRHI